MIESYYYANKITDIVERFLVKADVDKFESIGREALKEGVDLFTKDNKKLLFILPGFPCKSPNTRDKSFGVLPDFGEALAISRIDEMCNEISLLYPPGARVTLLSDGTTFSDIVGVDEDVRKQYNESIKKICITENINYVNLDCFFKKSLNSAEKIRSLIKEAGLKYKSLDDLKKAVKKSPELSLVHDKLCSYLYNDFKLQRYGSSTDDEYMKIISEKSYIFMYRGHALNANINKKFPDHVRLSIHQYDNAGPKFTFGLFKNSNKVISPWHSVPILKLNGTYAMQSHSTVDKSTHVLAKFNSNNWLYIETDSELATELEYEVQKSPNFGLVIKDPKNVGFDCLSETFLTTLMKEYAFVCIKNYKFVDQSKLELFSQRFGRIYQWDFGSVHVVKPDDKPDGFVHSLEKTPLHWDLSMLPLEHEDVKNDIWFSATKFFLYCKTPPAYGEGQTTVVDARLALKVAGQQKVDIWRETEITYNTKKTYFGGVPRTYPLIHMHPETGVEVLRYQEGSQSDLQKFELSNPEMRKDSFESLVEELNSVVYDERCFIAHDWEENDLVLMDNNLTLHGRLPMSKKSRQRELWRIQICS